MAILAPIQQILGSTYSGYQIFTYLAGTTTKTNTYTSSTEASANTNPIVLNANGGTSTGIWLKQGISYKFVLTTSTDSDPPVGSTITLDNVIVPSQIPKQRAVTTNYTVVIDDFGKLLLVDATAGSITVSLPTAASAGDGFMIAVKKIDSSSNTVTISGNGAETIDGSNTYVISGQYQAIQPVSNGTAWNLNPRANANLDSPPTYLFTATSAGPAALRVYEDTDNGTNYSAVTAASSLTSNRTFTLPDSDVPKHFVQDVIATTVTYGSGSTVTPYDDTIPQITEGNDSGMTATITPKSASNILEIDVLLHVATSAGVNVTAALFQDSTANALCVGDMAPLTANVIYQVTLRHRMVAGTTSATSFKARYGASAGTQYLNGDNAARRFGGVLTSYIHIKEYTP